MEARVKATKVIDNDDDDDGGGGGCCCGDDGGKGGGYDVVDHLTDSSATTD